MKKNYLIALRGILIALALVLSYLESLVPVFIAVPGVKLGIANIVTIFAISKLKIKDAVIISIGRVVLSGILFGGVYMAIYSAAGATLSILAMSVIKLIIGKFDSKNADGKAMENADGKAMENAEETAENTNENIIGISVTGISIIGAVFHNFGQILVAAIMLKNERIMYYMGILCITGAIAGAVIGVLSGLIINRVKLPGEES